MFLGEISGHEVWAEGPASFFILLWSAWNPDSLGRRMGRNLELTNPSLPGSGVCTRPMGNSCVS